MMVGERIAEAALSYVGTPFHHQGRKPGTGLDCVGVLACALDAAGVVVNDVRGYHRDPHPLMLLNSLKDNRFHRVASCNHALGNIAAMWFRNEGQPTHCGVFTSKGLVHVIDRRKVALAAPCWLTRIHSIWQVA